jgi:hypothetical protein
MEIIYATSQMVQHTCHNITTKMHCVYAIILQDAQHTFHNITTIHIALVYDFCTVHYDIIMQHKQMKWTHLKLML